MKPVGAVFAVTIALVAFTVVPLDRATADPRISVGIVIGAPPPGFVWVEGYWGPERVWYPPHWERPPFPYAVWHWGRWYRRYGDWDRDEAWRAHEWREHAWHDRGWRDDDRGDRGWRGDDHRDRGWGGDDHGDRGRHDGGGNVRWRGR